MEPRPVLDLHVELFQRDGQRILDDVKLTIRPDQHWTVVGPNGCGKSTLLSILSAYEWPTLGRVEVLGETYGLCDMNAMKRRIGIVGAALHQAISRHERAIDVAASGLYALLGPWRTYDEADYTAARHALERAGIAEDANKPYGLLSHGQRRRVAIARALVRRPRILVLDEPCEGLDPVAREKFLHDVDALTRGDDPLTLIYVTHHLDEIPPSVTHALVMREGRVVGSGPVADVLTADTLGVAFGAPCEVTRASGRFRLEVRVA